MPRVSKEDLLKRVNDLLGPEATDLSLLEDIQDTIEDDTALVEKDKEIEELKNKIAETETTWREKYRARFFDATPDTKPEPEIDEVDNGANPDDNDPPSFEEIAAMF